MMKNKIIKNVKRIFAGLVAAVVVAATAVQPVDTFAKNAGTEGKDYVIDLADILTDSEEEALSAKCKKASGKCKTDIVIITMRTGMDYSVLDNYIRSEIIEKSYGYNGDGDTPDAIVYAIDMVSRADRIITSGIAMSDISQTRLNNIREDAEEELKGGDYYSGCKKYINGVERALRRDLFYKLTLNLPFKLIISLVVAVVAVLVMRRNAKSKMTVDARNYTGRQPVIHRREDRFINTTVRTRHIESNSGGGGGGHSGGGNSGSSGGHF